MSESETFSTNVKTWIKTLVEEGERDFSSLVSRLPGVDPILVVETMKSLGAADSGMNYLSLCAQARIATPSNLEVLPSPFVPHPLDFDWRFTEDSAAELVRHVSSLESVERLALLGTPTLISAITTRLPSAVIRLFDKNRLWRSINGQNPQLEVIDSDLAAEALPARFEAWADTVLMDPPWYPSTQRAYLWTAAQIVRPGGLVVTTHPPLGTRPSIAAERTEIETDTRSLGFTVIDTCAGMVRYETPPFETNALRAAGVLRSLPEWRCGDVTVYEATRVAAVRSPRIAAVESIRWFEVAIDGVRIKIKDKGRAKDARDSPELLTLIDGDVLPSVSARHPVRDQVDVWTSGNRIYTCKNTAALLELCERMRDNPALRRDHAPSAAPSRDNGFEARVMRQVLGIVSLESGEYLTRR